MDRRPELEAALRAAFATAPAGVLAVDLFGSRARDRATPSSDVDLAVLYADDPPPTLEGLPLDLEAELERMCGLPVQIVVLNHAPVDLVHRVLRDGRLILDRDRSRRIRFEVKARNVRTLARPAAMQRFAEHTFQIAIQALLDAASHIVSDERLGEPRTNRELIDLLERARWIPGDLAVTLRRMVGLRNILVHGYETVDVWIVADIVAHRLDDLLAFSSVIRSKLD